MKDVGFERDRAGVNKGHRTHKLEHTRPPCTLALSSGAAQSFSDLSVPLEKGHCSEETLCSVQGCP